MRHEIRSIPVGRDEANRQLSFGKKFSFLESTQEAAILGEFRTIL